MKKPLTSRIEKKTSREGISAVHDGKRISYQQELWRVVLSIPAFKGETEGDLLLKIASLLCMIHLALCLPLIQYKLWNNTSLDGKSIDIMLTCDFTIRGNH